VADAQTLMIFIPGVVPKKDFISWSIADEENNAFHIVA
jgi:hypothetical protein